MKQKFANALSLALIMAMLFTSLALADQIVADADALVLSAPNGNGITATQASGTTLSYDFSAVIRDTGNSGNNVFAASGDSVSVAVAKNGSWVSGGTSGPWTFNAYESPQAGTIQIAIPCGSQDSTATMTVVLTATASNGQILNPNSRTLSYVITAGADDPSCTPPDTTAPTASPSIAGTPGTNGWYTSDVTVTWNWSDNTGGSGIDTNNCTMSSTSSGEGILTLSSECYDLAGNKGTASVDIKVDKTAPGIAFVSPSTSAWYNANVTANWNCSDATSGPVNTSVNGLASGEGLAVAATGTCVDNAGNSASNTQYFQIDKTAPTISGSASPAANGYGWNKTDVTVSFLCGDSLSGIASCGPNQTLSSEGAGQSATGTAVDNAGNTKSTTVSGINIDKTAPTAIASASPAANSFGWNNTDVTVSFSGLDSLSGIDTCNDPVTLSAEGAGQSASGTCTDKAGNVSALATASNMNIDKTAPSVSLVGGPANGGSYYFGSVPAIPTCSASDGLSGLDGSCSVSGYGTTVGTHTVIASATDKAGNSASASATYTVLAWTLNGFYQPVDMGDVWNTVRSGSTVPLKFEIFAGSTELTDPSIVNQPLRATQALCSGGTTDDIELLSSGATTLRYDATAGQFIYNWQTPRGKAGYCYVVTVTTADGSSISANFKLK